MIRKRLDLGSVSIAYLENEIVGPDALFIHGNSGGGESFFPQFEVVGSAGYHFLAPDLPGHGESSRDDRADTDGYIYSADYHADVLESFIRGLGVRCPVLIGHSLGGHIALRLSMRINARGLLLIGTPPLEVYEDLQKAFSSGEEKNPFFSADVTTSDFEHFVVRLFPRGNLPDRFTEEFWNTDPRARRNLALGMVPEASFGEATSLRSLRCPVRICLGGDDPLVSRDYVRDALGDSCTMRQLIVLPDCGHFPHTERPEDFNNLLARFFQDVERGT